jgi:hypothetical protein
MLCLYNWVAVRKANREVSATLDNPPRTLMVEGFGKLPSMDLLALADGTIKFRYIVEGGNYLGFDGEWHLVSVSEQREHLRLGGKIAEWLRTINHDHAGRVEK